MARSWWEWNLCRQATARQIHFDNYLVCNYSLWGSVVFTSATATGLASRTKRGIHRRGIHEKAVVSKGFLFFFSEIALIMDTPFVEALLVLADLRVPNGVFQAVFSDSSLWLATERDPFRGTKNA